MFNSFRDARHIDGCVLIPYKPAKYLDLKSRLLQGGWQEYLSDVNQDLADNEIDLVYHCARLFNIMHHEDTMSVSTTRNTLPCVKNTIFSGYEAANIIESTASMRHPEPRKLFATTRVPTEQREKEDQDMMSPLLLVVFDVLFQHTEIILNRQRKGKEAGEAQ